MVYISNYCLSRILENACKDDTELRAVIGDSIGDPDMMRKRVMPTHTLILLTTNQDLLLTAYCNIEENDM